jgi:hypothetical protein
LLLLPDTVASTREAAITYIRVEGVKRCGTTRGFCLIDRNDTDDSLPKLEVTRGLALELLASRLDD